MAETGFWTQARIAQLKRLWSAGSAATIGFELGGISRAEVDYCLGALAFSVRWCRQMRSCVM